MATEKRENKMRNIAEIIKDDRNGKPLSQIERQIAVAYTQGKYDAVRELKISNNSNTNEALDKIRAEIEKEADTSNRLYGISEIGLRKALKIIDKYKTESEERVNFADDLIPIINEAENEVRE